jgi:hypothetical protein
MVERSCESDDELPSFSGRKEPVIEITGFEEVDCGELAEHI